ncbi:MAG: 50S ribosomal protein L4 [Chlamydiota bacterium]
MADIKKYNLGGEQIGSVALDDALLEGVANTQMVKDYLVAYRANQRQWSASTKSRAEVNHSGQKPHPQKGTGRARQGYLGAPQYKGGGRVFGPKPKFDQQVKINKKEKRAVIRSLLVQKIQEQHLHILSVEGLSKPKTKSIVDFLKKMNLFQKRVLFVGGDFFASMDYEIESVEALTKIEDSYVASAIQKDVVVKSLRNVPKLSFSLLPNLNGYEVILNQDIVLLDGNIDQLVSILGGEVVI